MRIKEDKSYLTELDKKAILDGLARLYVYSIRLDRFFTDEEMQENQRQAQALTREEWAKRCDRIAEEIGKQNRKAVDELEKNFYIGQYSKNFDGNGAFWFWCNTDENGRRMDYITLTTQGTEKEKNANAEEAKRILQGIETENNIAIFQYATEYDAKRLEEIAEAYATEKAGQFVKYAGMTGKIMALDGSLNGGKRWAFMKKGAKTKGYLLSALNIYDIKTANE